MVWPEAFGTPVAGQKTTTSVVWMVVVEVMAEGVRELEYMVLPPLTPIEEEHGTKLVIVVTTV